MGKKIGQEKDKKLSGHESGVNLPRKSSLEKTSQ
jgi:hypothetical protein